MSVAPMTNDMCSPVDPALRRGRGPSPVRQMSQLGGQASTLREMLRSLEDLTLAGQRHTMEKIVAFLADHLPAAGRKRGRRNRNALVLLLLSLRRESQRCVLDVPLFSRQAESILVLMGALPPQGPR